MRRLVFKKRPTTEEAEEAIKDFTPPPHIKEQFDRIVEIHRKVTTKTKYSETIDSIEELFERKLNKKIELLLAFYDYKTILYQHFMEIQKLENEKD